MSSLSKCDDNLCIDKPKSFYDKIYSITGLFRKRPQEIRYPQRPLFRSEFGSITWTLFHRICAYYPTTPSKEEKKLINNMFEGFAEFFPCKECKDDLILQMQKHKIDTSSKINLSKWFCIIHNETNKKIGKPEMKLDNMDDIIKMFII